MDTVHISLLTIGFDCIPSSESSSVTCHPGAPFLVAGAHSRATACGGVSLGLISGSPVLLWHLPNITDPEPSPYSPPAADGEVSALYIAADPAAVVPVVLPFTPAPGLAKRGWHNVPQPILHSPSPSSSCCSCIIF